MTLMAAILWCGYVLELGDHDQHVRSQAASLTPDL